MRTQKTLTNAALKTVNNGYIEICCNHKTLSFNNASLISVNGGTIIIETEWEPTEGELIKIEGGGTNIYAIFKKREKDCLWDYGYVSFNDILGCNTSTIPWVINSKIVITPASEEESKRFHEYWKQRGQMWNPMTLKWGPFIWKPCRGSSYYTIVRLHGTLQVIPSTWTNAVVDHHCYEQRNCFETKEEAEKKLNQIIQLLKE